MRISKLVIALACVVASCGAAVGAGTIPVVVQGTPVADRTIVMTGIGIVKAMPDTAKIGAGVVTRARRAPDALAANNEAMANAVKALKAEGITDKEIATSSFTFEPQHETDRNGNIDPGRRIIGYSVSNRITVTLTEGIERAGQILETLIENGANDTTDVSFEIHDMESLEKQARAEAAKNALAHAQDYVKQIGAELGPVRSVREGYQQPIVMESISAEDIGALPDRSVSNALQRIPGVPVTRIAAGEQTITKVVTVVWALK
ncbi:MAG TPA: SIMPL domain-containing protein [Rhizomicrobium sp.]|nr:SIMPL domain-containing protein [Rhizomicrobium sp.]